MHLLLKTDAIILKEEDSGEFDKIFTIFSKNFGKIKVIGKSIRKKDAKLKYILQVLNYINLELIEGKNFYIVCDATLKNNFQDIRNNFSRIKIALKILNNIDDFLQGEEEDRRIWNLILLSIQKLSQPGNYRMKNLKIFYFYFIWKLISFLGFNPELYRCVSCKMPLQEKKFYSKKERKQKYQKNYFNGYFLIKDGGLLCQECSIGYHDKKIAVSPNTIKLLRLVLKGDRILKKIRISQDDEEELKKVTGGFVDYFGISKFNFN